MHGGMGWGVQFWEGPVREGMTQMSEVTHNLSFPSSGLLQRHSRSHEHDIVKALALFVKVLEGLLRHLIAISGVSRGKLAIATFSIFGAASVLLLLVYMAYLVRDIFLNGCSPRKNKEEWLLAGSKVLIVFGALSYHTGDNLPGYLADFSHEIHCDTLCVRRGLVVGAVLVFISLTLFRFIPQLFRKINTLIDENYDENFICGGTYEAYRTQWFVIRMAVLTLDFDATYTTIWSYTFVYFENCGLDDIIGSTACILTGWFIWTAYAVTYTYYLTDMASIVQHFRAYKQLHVQYLIINVLYYTTLVLYLTTFFPIHILADNEEPLSCGCAGATANNSLTVFTCRDRPGVLETRLALLLYQVMVLAAMGCLGVVKDCLQETEYSSL